MSNRLKEALEALEMASSSLAKGNDSLSTLAFRIVSFASDGPNVALKPRFTTASLQRWADYLQSIDQEPSARDLKNLCWEPQVAFDVRFVNLLKQKLGDRLTRRCQAGLIYCLAVRWEETVEDTKIADPIRSYLFGDFELKYGGQVARFLSQENGVASFVQEKTQSFPQISEILKSTFGLVLEGTQYAAALRTAIGKSYSGLLFSDNTVARRWLFSEILKPLEKRHVISIIDQSVSNQIRVPTESVLNDFRDFLFEYKDLGDPRAEGGSFKWKGVQEGTRKKVSEWLSQEDIRFFFDTFFDNEKDMQGRKAFWMRYASSVQRTRVVVGDIDLGKRSRLPKTIQASSTIGTLRDGGSSAFIMDFGTVVVVEFSLENNACYFYSPDSKSAVTTKFWSTSFKVSELKNRKIGRPITHRLHFWQQNFSRELSLLGVRPRKD